MIFIAVSVVALVGIVVVTIGMYGLSGPDADGQWMRASGHVILAGVALVCAVAGFVVDQPVAAVVWVATALAQACGAIVCRGAAHRAASLELAAVRPDTGEESPPLPSPATPER